MYESTDEKVITYNYYEGYKNDCVGRKLYNKNVQLSTSCQYSEIDSKLVASSTVYLKDVLKLAFQNNHFEVVKWVTSKIEIYTLEGIEEIFPYLMKQDSPNLEILQHCFDNKISINMNRNYDVSIFLDYTCKKGQLNVVEFLIKNKINLGSWFSSSIKKAYSNRHWDVVKTLLENGSSVFNKDTFEKILEDNRLDVYKLILKNKPFDEYSGSLPALDPLLKNYPIPGEYFELIKVFLENNLKEEKCLLLGAQKNDTEFIKFLLETYKSKNNNEQYPGIDKALNIAVENKYLEGTKILLENGAKITDNTINLIVKKYSFQLFELIINHLVEHKNDLNTKYNDKELIFFVLDKVDALKLLIDKGASIDVYKDNTKSPLYIACKKGFIDSIKILLKAGAKAIKYENLEFSPLCAASAKSNEIVQILLQESTSLKEVGFESKEFEVITTSIRKTDDLNIIKTFLDNVKVTQPALTKLEFLCYALDIQDDRTDILDRLLEESYFSLEDCKQKGESSLSITEFICKNLEHVDLIKIFIKNLSFPINAPEGQKSLLHYAAIHNNNADVFKYLCKKGAKINAKDEKDITPAMYSLMNFSDTTELLEILKQYKADLSINDHEGKNILHHIMLEPTSVDNLGKILYSGIIKDVNVKDATGNTALDYLLKRISTTDNNDDIISSGFLLFTFGAKRTEKLTETEQKFVEIIEFPSLVFNQAKDIKSVPDRIKNDEDLKNEFVKNLAYMFKHHVSKDCEGFRGYLHDTFAKVPGVDYKLLKLINKQVITDNGVKQNSRQQDIDDALKFLDSLNPSKFTQNHKKSLLNIVQKLVLPNNDNINENVEIEGEESYEEAF